MNSKIRKEIWEWFETLSVSIFIAVCISLIAQPTIVSGQSMYPTLEIKIFY